MKPQVLREVAVLGRGLWVVEGPDGPALVVKAGKEFILAARERRELRLYVAPYNSGDVTGFTLLTACFDDSTSPLMITTPLLGEDPLTQAFKSFPDEFSICFFDEHNRELLSCSAQARLDELREHVNLISPLEGDHWHPMMEQADIWFGCTTAEDDARAMTVSLLDDLFPSDFFITDLTRQGFQGSAGFSNTQLERPEPGHFQEVDIIYLLQRAYSAEQIIHGPLEVADGEELVDAVVLGSEVTLLLQARRDGNPPLRLVNGAPLDIDLATRPLVGVVVVKELFIDAYDEYGAMILEFMDDVAIRVLAFDYNEFEVMTRNCPSEQALLSAFWQISECARERRIYPKLRFTGLPPR
jgi:hypothetical protein